MGRLNTLPPSIVKDPELYSMTFRNLPLLLTVLTGSAKPMDRLHFQNEPQSEGS